MLLLQFGLLATLPSQSRNDLRLESDSIKYHVLKTKGRVSRTSGKQELKP